MVKIYVNNQILKNGPGTPKIAFLGPKSFLELSSHIYWELFMQKNHQKKKFSKKSGTLTMAWLK